MQHAFGAPFEAVDFAKSPERARQHIDGCVEKETEYHGNDLVPRDGIDRHARLVLVLRDTKTGMILFMGRVADPSTK